jgi:predicted nucleic acid-binding protein
MERINPPSVALDSDTISFVIKERFGVNEKYEAALQNGIHILISPFIYYEVKWGLVMINATSRLRTFAEICAQCNILPAQQSVFEEAVRVQVELKQQKWNIDDVDIFNAAYCIVNNIVLVTHNTQHYQPIRGLKLSDWVSDT